MQHDVRVIFGDTDQMGIVYYANYYRYFEGARAAYLRDKGRSYKDIYIGAAALAAFDGERVAGLKAMRSALEHGWRDRLIFENPMIEPFQDDPAFIELEALLEAILAEERDRVLDLVCLNNPVPDDWRPLPETCVGFPDSSLAAY